MADYQGGGVDLDGVAGPAAWVGHKAGGVVGEVDERAQLMIFRRLVMEGDGIADFFGKFPLLQQAGAEGGVVDEAQLGFDLNPVGVFFESGFVRFL